MGRQIFFELGFQGSVFLGGGKFVDDVDGVGKEHGMPFQAGSISQSGGQVGFAQADGAQEDGVGFVFDKLETEEVLDLEAVDLFGPIPAELFEGFEDGEAGFLDAALDGALAALMELAFDQALEILKVIPMLLGGLLGGGRGVLFDEGQLEVGQMFV